MVLRDNVFGTPEEDALRRDFTINALAYNIADFTVIDYVAGLSDLEQRLIRPIGEPAVRFTEDPVRMLRAVRFAASHDFTIDPAAWEVICDLSSTIARAAPARLYEEMLKLFLLGSASPVFHLMEDSGLLAALFPDLCRWMGEDIRRREAVQVHLEGLDRLAREGMPPAPSLFLAALFGPGLEDAALAMDREGIPRQQALHAACSAFLETFCQTVFVPGRVGSQMRSILAIQPSLHRMPPRRPASLSSRPEFADALVYLRLTAKSRGEKQDALDWWEAFLSRPPAAAGENAPAEDEPVKKKRRRRRRRRASGKPPEL
jgi:poly(A) polymerase